MHNHNDRPTCARSTSRSFTDSTEDQEVPPLAQPLILIHGIASDGSWHENLRPTLEPFFNLVCVRYGEYISWGLLKVVAEPRLFAPAAVLLALSWWMRGPLSTIVAAAAAVVFTAAFVPSIVRIRRNKSLQMYLKSAGACFQARPHVIAHSFGSYLTAVLLRKTPTALIDRLILVGCVLPRRQKWRKFIDASQLGRIRNEWTRTDSLPRLAAFAGLFHRDLGAAGCKGFLVEDTAVHDLPHPLAKCRSCGPKSGAVIHNADCSGFGHSTALLAQGHARMSWIPFLWDIDPGEYNQLLSTCLRYRTAKQSHRWEEVARLELFLQTKRWDWAEGRPLWKQLALTSATVLTDLQLSFAMRRFCVAFARAAMAAPSGKDYLYLWLPRAAAFAVRRA